MKKLLTIVLISIAGLSYGQQPTVNSLYMFDQLRINPAYAGAHVQLSATAVHRNQWVNFPGAPKTSSATIPKVLKKISYRLLAYRLRLAFSIPSSIAVRTRASSSSISRTDSSNVCTAVLEAFHFCSEHQINASTFI